MKKVSTLLLTGLLGSSMLFAGFSGSANVDAFYNLDNNDYGLANGTSLVFDVNLIEEVGSTKGSGEVYAEINAKLAVRAFNGEKGDSDNNEKFPAQEFLPVAAKIESAKIYGENWSVDIKETLGGPDMAKSAIDEVVDNVDDTFDDFGFKTKETKKPVSYSVGYNKAPGLAVKYGNIDLGVGFFHDDSASANDYSVYAGLTDVELVEGFKMSGAVVGSDNAATVAADSTEIRSNVLGASGKLAYAMDGVEVSAAGDLGYDVIAKDVDGFDFAAKAAYDAFTLDAYVASGRDVDVKLSTDLNSYDVPVTLSVSAKNLLVATREVSAEAVLTAVEDLKLTLKGSYTLDGSKYSAGAEAEYTSANLGTLKANFDYAKGNVIGAGVSVENTTLIDGATLSAGWYDAEDITRVGTDADKELGQIKASCKISF